MAKKAKKVQLNPSTVNSIKDAGSRSMALAFFEEMLNSPNVSKKLANAVRERAPFKGSDVEEDYYRYLCKVRYLISRCYPLRQRSVA